MLTEDIAHKLDLDPRELERQSLRAYIEARLRQVEAEWFLLVKKYGVQTVEAFDALVAQGKLHEADAFEDFFSFDYLESQRQKLQQALDSLQ